MCHEFCYKVTKLWNFAVYNLALDLNTQYQSIHCTHDAEYTYLITNSCSQYNTTSELHTHGHMTTTDIHNTSVQCSRHVRQWLLCICAYEIKFFQWKSILLSRYEIIQIFQTMWVDRVGSTCNKTHYRSYRERVLRVKWPNQQCQSTEGNNGPKDQASIPPGPPHSVTILHMHTIYTQTQNNAYTEMNLSTVKWAQWDKTQSRELLGLFICVRIALCTIVAHNTAHNRPDNFPSCPPDNHHCSDDDVYLREGGGATDDVGVLKNIHKRTL